MQLTTLPNPVCKVLYSFLGPQGAAFLQPVNKKIGAWCFLLIALPNLEQEEKLAHAYAETTNPLLYRIACRSKWSNEERFAIIEDYIKHMYPPELLQVFGGVKGLALLPSASRKGIFKFVHNDGKLGLSLPLCLFSERTLSGKPSKKRVTFFISNKKFNVEASYVLDPNLNSVHLLRNCMDGKTVEGAIAIPRIMRKYVDKIVYDRTCHVGVAMECTKHEVFANLTAYNIIMDFLDNINAEEIIDYVCLFKKWEGLPLKLQYAVGGFSFLAKLSSYPFFDAELRESGWSERFEKRIQGSNTALIRTEYHWMVAFKVQTSKDVHFLGVYQRDDSLYSFKIEKNGSTHGTIISYDAIRSIILGTHPQFSLTQEPLRESCIVS